MKKVTVTISIVLMTSIFLVSSCTTDQTTTTQENEVTTSQYTEQSTSPAKLKTIDLNILSYSSYIEYGSYRSFSSGKDYQGDFLHIIGEVQNPSSLSVQFDNDNVKATFYDATGSVVDVDFILRYRFSFADEVIIPPMGNWPFRLTLLDEEASESVASYEISARARETRERPLQVEVLNFGMFSNGSRKLVGEVENTTSDNIETRIIAIFYDETGSVIAADIILPSAVLRPSEKGPFWLSPLPKEALGEIERCELIAKYEISTEVCYREFEILNVVHEEGPDWKWDTLTGKVRNTGNQSCTSVWVYAIFYNAEGNVIDWGLSDVEPTQLEPGDIGTFELIAPSSPWQMPNYALLVVVTLPS
jgi:hypothetical protein